MPRVSRTSPIAIGVIGVLVLLLIAFVASRILGSRQSGNAEYVNHVATVAPGHLVSAKPFRKGLPHWVRGWRIVYGTSDAQGNRVRASGVVLVSKRAHQGPRPVLSVGHGTTGIQPSCAPSHSSTFPAQPRAVPFAMLRQGWAVVQSDYIGQGIADPHGEHPYLVGSAEAHAVLDATRASRQLKPAAASRRTVLYGMSQGGHAVLFAGRQARSYAPDLRVLGVATGAPATDLAAMLAGDGKRVPALVVSAYIADAWNSTYPSAHVRRSVTHWKAAKAIAGKCASGAAKVAVKHERAAPLFSGKSVKKPVKKLFARNTPLGPIGVPVFVGQGTADTIVPALVQSIWARKECAGGQHLTVKAYPGRNHTTLGAVGSPYNTDVIAWIKARLAGRHVHPTC